MNMSTFKEWTLLILCVLLGALGAHTLTLEFGLPVAALLVIITGSIYENHYGIPELFGAVPFTFACMVIWYIVEMFYLMAGDLLFLLNKIQIFR